MLISVITVCRNAAASIKNALDSVAMQTYPNLEHIVIDGHSNDGTQAIVAAARHRVRWISEPDRGIYHAMNKGLALARGELLLFLNADDAYASPTVIQSLYEAQCRLSDPKTIVYGDFVNEDPRWGYCQLVKTCCELHRGMTLCHQAMAVPRIVYQELGGYDTRWQIAADYAWCLRAWRQGIPFVHVPEPICYFRMGGAAQRHAWTTACEAARLTASCFGWRHGLRVARAHIKWALRDAYCRYAPRAFVDALFQRQGWQPCTDREGE